jgi:exosome complex exonuclease DIS3/RRP44
LVEEFMLLANITVASRIFQSFPQTALLRRHTSPPPQNFEQLTAQLSKKRSLTLDVSSSFALAKSLDRCVDPADPFFDTLIRILATRCMRSAEYFCAGTHAEPEFRHYGLASPIYTHFTSPIRRYADLVVHRQLAAAIGYGGPGNSAIEALSSRGRLEDICRNLNYRHRNAQLAGRASVEYYVGQALKARGEQVSRIDAEAGAGSSGTNSGVEEEGYVMRVFENGVVVFVPRFGIEGVVGLDDFMLPGQKRPEAVRSGANQISARRESEFDPEEYSLKVWEKGVDGESANGEKQGSMVVELFEKLRVNVSSVQEQGRRGAGKRRVRILILGKA